MRGKVGGMHVIVISFFSKGSTDGARKRDIPFRNFTENDISEDAS